MPHIVYFDTFDDLTNKLETINLEEVSNKMKKFNIKRKELIIEKWKNKIIEIYG